MVDLETDPMTPEEGRREFRVSPARLHHGLLVAAVVAAIGLGILLFAGPAVPDSEIIGAVALALAAGLAGFALHAARDPRPRLIVDSQGVWFRDWGLPRVPWRGVAAVQTVGIRLQPYVCVELRRWEDFVATLDEATRARCGANRLIRWPRLRIPNNAVDATFDEILAALRDAKARADGDTAAT